MTQCRQERNINCHQHWDKLFYFWRHWVSREFNGFIKIFSRWFRRWIPSFIERLEEMEASGYREFKRSKLRNFYMRFIQVYYFHKSRRISQMDKEHSQCYWHENIWEGNFIGIWAYIVNQPDNVLHILRSYLHQLANKIILLWTTKAH